MVRKSLIIFPEDITSVGIDMETASSAKNPHENLRALPQYLAHFADLRVVRGHGFWPLRRRRRQSDEEFSWHPPNFKSYGKWLVDKQNLLYNIPVIGSSELQEGEYDLSMKIIDEKGKLFGLINLVDLLVVLFILLVAGGIVWKIFGGQVQELVANTTELTYTVRIRATHPRYYDELTSRDFPLQLAAGDSLIENAYIVSAVKEPYIAQIGTDDGKLIDVVDPTRIDIVCTIEAKINDTDVIKVGTQEVRAGKDHIVKTKHFEMVGTIESVLLANE